MSKSPTAQIPQADASAAQLDQRDLDQVSGGLLPAVAPQTITSPRDPAAYAGGPKLGIPLI